MILHPLGLNKCGTERTDLSENWQRKTYFSLSYTEYDLYLFVGMEALTEYLKTKAVTVEYGNQ